MNQNQRKYAIERIQSLASSKKQAITKKHTTVGVSINSSQKLDAIRKGEFTINKKRLSERGYVSWYDCINFTAETERKVDKKAAKKEYDAIDKALLKVTDEIMLGDSEVATKLIAQFENKYG